MYQNIGENEQKGIRNFVKTHIFDIFHSKIMDTYITLC